MNTPINDIRLELISLITRTEDVDMLRSMRDNLSENIKNTDASLVDTENVNGRSVKKLKFEDAGVEIVSRPSFDEIHALQGGKSITYAEVRSISDDIEWEHSLEELLAALN